MTFIFLSLEAIYSSKQDLFFRKKIIQKINSSFRLIWTIKGFTKPSLKVDSEATFTDAYLLTNINNNKTMLKQSQTQLKRTARDRPYLFVTTVSKICFGTIKNY